MDSPCVLLCNAGIGKRKFAESVKGDALHEAGGNDAVRVNIVTGEEDTATGDLSDFF